MAERRRLSASSRAPASDGSVVSSAARTSQGVVRAHPAAAAAAGSSLTGIHHRARFYRGPADDFFGSVGSKPEIYPIYWSSAQLQARQHDRMAQVQRFLNRQWKHESEGAQWFDPNRDSLYPDRIRRRPEGANSAGLGTHLDPGNLDLWMTEAYQKAFRHLFDGTHRAVRPVGRGLPHRRTAVLRHDDVLGLPHLPGLDRPVRHGP